MYFPIVICRLACAIISLKIGDKNMSQNQYKTPKAGGATKIKESFTDHRKRQPSKTLLEILKKKPSQKHKQSDKKVTKKIVWRTPAIGSKWNVMRDCKIPGFGILGTADYHYQNAIENLPKD